MKKFLLQFLLVFALFPFYSLAQSQDIPSDAAVDVPAPYNYKTEPQYKKVKKESIYITMPDGVKLAANVYLPKGLKEGQKIPTILYQTRYWRAIDFRWPFSAFMNMVPSGRNFDVMEFVHNGYALVALDVRGTGASFGEKSLTLPSWNEVQDGSHVVDWIVSQPWSDGKVGATGISYIGITALYLAINQNPAVKAIAPMYSVYDIYDDIALPGGIFMQDFIKEYGGFCEALDHDKLTLNKGFMAKLVVKGVEPVKGHHREFKEALAQHNCNYYQDGEGDSPEFIDDSTTLNGKVDVKYAISPHLYLKEINASNIPVYSYSGWWDLAFTHGAVKQYMNFTNRGRKLLIGPWSHGGPININPANPSFSRFNHIGEIMKFFDYYLKGEKNGLEKEAPVHYYTMVEDKWKSASTWPPPNAANQSFYVSSDKKMSQKTDVSGSSYTTFVTDSSSGTGVYSRWNLSDKAIPENGYPDRQPEDDKRIYFDTDSLKADVEVTGHPVVSVYMTSSVPDVGVFAYLEDVDENGKVTRVTEGLIRAEHKKVLKNPPFYKDAVPYHSFKREDAGKLSATQPEAVVFDLFPTSYLFKKGHKIRVSICGNDKDYFKQITPNGTQWKIYHSAKYTSKIDLPVMPRQELAN